MSLDIIKEIKKLKEEKNVTILAHNYVIPSIQELADYVGDSLGLARKSAELETDLILFAGVTFMAETTSILCPDKTIIAPSLLAECPMAAQLTPDMIIEARKQYPDAVVAVYVNTTAEVKAEADICYTSGNAVKIINSLKEKVILSGPDNNLTSFISEKLPEKILIPIPPGGGCYVHKKFTKDQVIEAKRLYPEAKVLIHPEASEEVRQYADHISSTEGMITVGKNDSASEFIIVTELGMVDRLRREIPEKLFHPVSPDSICWQMKKNSLYNLYHSLKYETPIIKVPDNIGKRARKAISRMIEIR